MRTLGTGSGLVAQVRRDGRERTAFGYQQVFGMRTERALGVSNTLSPTSKKVTPLPTPPTSPANSFPRTVTLGLTSMNASSDLRIAGDALGIEHPRLPVIQFN